MSRSGLFGDVLLVGLRFHRFMLLCFSLKTRSRGDRPMVSRKVLYCDSVVFVQRTLRCCHRRVVALSASMALPECSWHKWTYLFGASVGVPCMEVREETLSRDIGEGQIKSRFSRRRTDHRRSSNAYFWTTVLEFFQSLFEEGFC